MWKNKLWDLTNISRNQETYREKRLTLECYNCRIHYSETLLALRRAQIPSHSNALLPFPSLCKPFSVRDWGWLVALTQVCPIRPPVSQRLWSSPATAPPALGGQDQPHAALWSRTPQALGIFPPTSQQEGWRAGGDSPVSCRSFHTGLGRSSFDSLTQFEDIVLRWSLLILLLVSCIHYSKVHAFEYQALVVFYTRVQEDDNEKADSTK